LTDAVFPCVEYELTILYRFTVLVFVLSLDLAILTSLVLIFQVSHSTSSPLSLVVYARRRLPPTHVRYDVRHTLTTAPTYVTSFLTSVTSMTSEKLTTPTARRRLPVSNMLSLFITRES